MLNIKRGTSKFRRELEILEKTSVAEIRARARRHSTIVSSNVLIPQDRVGGEDSQCLAAPFFATDFFIKRIKGNAQRTMMK